MESSNASLCIPEEMIQKLEKNNPDPVVSCTFFFSPFIPQLYGRVIKCLLLGLIFFSQNVSLFFFFLKAFFFLTYFATDSLERLDLV